MTASIPDWLSIRGGELRPGPIGATWLVLLNGSLAYKAAIVPAHGKFTCVVTQTNNGKRLDRGSEFPTADAALAGGLNDLQQALGW